MADGAVIRIRKCPGCKIRFRTLEEARDDIVIKREEKK